jgi:photosystem II stability/assembly factor-like uncharacterized protein
VRKSTVGPIAALCLWGLATTATAEPVSHQEIRQNLFTTCSAPDGRRWIVGELGRIYSTPDNGQTIFRSGAGTKEAFLAIACSPDGPLLITGQNGLIMRSRDAGESWQKLDAGTDRALLAATYADADTALAIGDYGTIVRTTDGGDSWSKAALPEEVDLPEDIAMIIEPGDVLLYGIDFPTPTKGWIVGEFGVIVATEDGGQTWVSQTTPIETTLFGVSFADDMRGWAVGIDEVLLHTEDGGQTWVRQTIPRREGFVLGIYNVAVEGNIGWAVGDNGLMLLSTNGGRSWERVNAPIEFAANWFRDIDLNKNGEGLVVGGNGIMLSTKNDQFQKVGGR